MSKKPNFQTRSCLALSLTTALTTATAVALPVTFAGNAYAATTQEAAKTLGSQLIDAVNSENTIEVLHLLQNGESASQIGEFGTTPLMRAVAKQNIEIAMLLIRSGAEVDAADIGGATALHIAARNGSTSIAKALLRAKANANAADNDGNTPLMLAASKGNVEIAKALLEKGAEANATNDSGETALIYATNSKNAEIIDALNTAGAEKEVADEEGFSPLEIAERSNDGVLVAKLDRKNPDHVIIEMGAGFRATSPKEMDTASASPQSLATTQDEPIDLAAAENNLLAPQEFIDYGDDIAPVNTPAFSKKSEQLAQLETASGAEKSWLSSLTSNFKEAGAFDLASVKNYQEGSTYALLELGSFKNRDFAQKRLDELQDAHPDIFNKYQLAIFKKGEGDKAEFVVNAGIMDSRDEANNVCKNLTAGGVRCQALESALITKEEFQSLTSPQKSAFSAPEVQAQQIASANQQKTLPTPAAPVMTSPETQKTLGAAKLPSLPPLPPLETEIAPPAKPSLTKALGSSKPPSNPSKPIIEEAMTAKAAPAPQVSQSTLSVPPTAERHVAAAETISEKIKQLPPIVSPKAALKPVEAEEVEISDEEEKSLTELAGMDEKDQPQSEEKSVAENIVSDIFKEKEVTEKKLQPKEVDNTAIKIGTPRKVLPEIAEGETPTSHLSKNWEVKNTKTDLPEQTAEKISAPKKLAAAKPQQAKVDDSFSGYSARLAEAQAALRAQQPQANAPVIAQYQPAIQPIIAETPPALKPVAAEIEQPAALAPIVAETSKIQASLPVQAAQPPVIAKLPAPVQPEILQNSASFELAQATPSVSLPTPTTRADKFVVSKPVRVIEDSAPTALPETAYDGQPTSAAPLTKELTLADYIYSVPTYQLADRKEKRRSVRIGNFESAGAAESLFVEYQRSGILPSYVSFKSGRSLTSSYFSANIGEFKTSQQAKDFCRIVSEQKELACTVENQTEYKLGANSSYGNGAPAARHSSSARH